MKSGFQRNGGVLKLKPLVCQLILRHFIENKKSRARAHTHTRVDMHTLARARTPLSPSLFDTNYNFVKIRLQWLQLLVNLAIQ